MIWLVDCFCCDPLTRMKGLLGKPLSFALELHAWWHIGTGIGGYLLAVSLQLLVLSLKEDPRQVSLEWGFGGWLPMVVRTSKGGAAKST